MSKKAVSVDTFGCPSERRLAMLCSDKPRVFNDEVSVVRYRITVEEIEEPKEVIRARLIELLKERGHIDKNRAVRREAQRLGIDLNE